MPPHPRPQTQTSVQLEQRSIQADNRVQQRLATAAQLADAAGRHFEQAGALTEKVQAAFAMVAPGTPVTAEDLIAVKEVLLEFMDVTSRHAHAIRMCASACMDVARDPGYQQGAMSMPPSNRTQIPPPPPPARQPSPKVAPASMTPTPATPTPATPVPSARTSGAATSAPATAPPNDSLSGDEDID